MARLIPNSRKEKLGSCNRCGVALEIAVTIRASSAKNHDYICKPCLRSREMDRRREMKAAVIEAYGGQCSCCGESRWQFLTIDAIDGDGREHHREQGPWFYGWLKSLGYPKDKWRLHCMNCNFSRGRYGHCPHDSESAEQQRGA